jgi:hypothetical protein
MSSLVYTVYIEEVTREHIHTSQQFVAGHGADAERALRDAERCYKSQRKLLSYVDFVAWFGRAYECRLVLMVSNTMADPPRTITLLEQVWQSAGESED